jgi:hypothetical protein
MKRSIALAVFTCSLVGLGLAQTGASPSTQTDASNVPQLLEMAHNLLQSVPPETRIDALADLVVVANRTKDLRADTWLGEVERLAERDTDPCRRARYQARMIEVVNTRDPRAALERLRRTDATCPDPLSSAATVVFLAAFKMCAAECVEDLTGTADHLGQLGSYPFSAVAALGQQVKAGEPTATRLFMNAVSAYKNASTLNWRAHRSFLSLVERQRNSVAKPAVVEAVSAAIARIGDSHADAGLQHVMLAENETARQYTDHDIAISELYRLAEAVDDGLAKKVVERWPDAPRIKIDDSKMTSGVAIGGEGPLPKSAQLYLEIEQAKRGFADSSATDIQKSGFSGTATIALLAWRASVTFPKDHASALQYLESAADRFGRLDDRMSKVLAAPYLVEAAVTCGDMKIASSTAQLQFDSALRLLRELQAEKPTPITQTPLFWSLRQTVKALRDIPSVLACLQGVQDDELRARLIIAATDSVSQPRR